ncbi:endolytic transglycosylase MltG [Candidatus Poriferisocius sp.]|uniref:endolytic transglycosylase MltG n=1 Tax=Candidatus Poriferisocius sp. TaxID=3101276 RepID=UPI003B5A5E8B
MSERTPAGYRPPVVVTDGDDPGDWDWLPRRTSTLTRVLIIAACAGVVLLVGSLWLKGWIDDRLDPPGDEGPELVVNIPSGAGINDIARILEDEGVVPNSTVFRYYLRFKDAGDVQAGNYLLHENMSVWRAKDVLLAGPAPGLADDSRRVVLPEGLTLAQIQAELVSQVATFSADDLARALAFPPLRSQYQPANSTLEGMLFPDTYLLDDATAGDEAALVVRLVNQFDAVAAEVGLADAPDTVGVSPYEAVIVASLVEKEALIDEDRAKIARVIYNRLGMGWPLQIDAAVRYAVNKPTDPLTLSDLDVDNPYNVYNRTGLPPGPIAAPGRASLAAALNPAEGFWLFYARTDDPVPGAHTFSLTAEEHEVAVALCRERELGC